MFRKIEDFEESWKYETEQTVKLLKNLTDESLSQKVTEDGRELGFIAWHVAQTMDEMLQLAGLKINAPNPEAPCPKTAAEITEAFDLGARSVLDEVKTNWTDETLLEEDKMYGETWARGKTLYLLVTHQAHHRGQITVLMRQAGLKVIGVYGPAKEEWDEMGMPALA
ncbi:MAG: DinB family protein [Acidobacteriota bacterium]|nr:DinB family protein [Acidobacteriota bacterium]MDH3530862.1 DinB family protein [Acidobacteriota bacterium]